MTPIQERHQLVELIEEAVRSGARKSRACSEASLSVRTLQRWQIDPDKVKEDARSKAFRPEPVNKLNAVEVQAVLDVCNTPEMANLPPTQIVPRLADRGVYLASESSFYRILKKHGQSKRRGRARAPRAVKPPTSYTAKKANELWSWDISYLPSQVKGLYFYLYFFEDIYSRMIVGSEVYPEERGELAADLVQRAVMSEKCCGQTLVLHSDNGAPMKSSTLLAKLYDLGITPSRGRPRVSNDNPYSESLFRTLKYCPQWPAKGFANIEEARVWVSEFVSWYNHEHRHSRIRFVTPAQRHQGMDIEILKRRSEVYQKAKENNPIRWSGKTRNWSHIDKVELNQENQTKIRA